MRAGGRVDSGMQASKQARQHGCMRATSSERSMATSDNCMSSEQRRLEWEGTARVVTAFFVAVYDTRRSYCAAFHVPMGKAAVW